MQPRQRLTLGTLIIPNSMSSCQVLPLITLTKYVYRYAPVLAPAHGHPYDNQKKTDCMIWTVDS